MKKGGPRSSLFQLCRKLQWPMPVFRTTETTSRYAGRNLLDIQINAYLISPCTPYAQQIIFCSHLSTVSCQAQFYSEPFVLNFLRYRTPISFGEGPNKREGFNSYASEITLHMPNRGDIVVMGEARADKKSSYDSAALLMLHKLDQLGHLIIGRASVP